MRVSRLLRDTAVSPAIVADRAIAARLYGDFPYGRPSGRVAGRSRASGPGGLDAGSRTFPEFKQRHARDHRRRDKTARDETLRQLLGPWRKSEQIVPTTFRQPNPLTHAHLIVNVLRPKSPRYVLAVRGVSRSDTDFSLPQFWPRVAQHRWQATAPELITNPFSLAAMLTSSGHFRDGRSSYAIKLLLMRSR